jgi:hypothetical protein
MKCQELLKVLNEYVEGEIDPAVISLYKNDQVYELPADFKQRLHKALQDKWKKQGKPPSDKPSGQES